jgi:hypothetical protein
MKRLRKMVNIALAWTSVCLLSVDPASACRLLNRRCCSCCCPVEPTCCGENTEKSPPPTGEQSPSDLPRPTASEAAPAADLPTNSVPTSPSVHLQPSVGVVRASAADHSQPAASTTAPAVANAANTPAITESGVEHHSAGSDQPALTTAPLPTTNVPHRQLSDVQPSSITNAADAGPSPGQPLTDAAPANISPQKTTLTPKQAISPRAPTVQAAPSPDRVIGVTPIDPAANSKASVRENSTDAVIAENSTNNPARHPAAASAAPPAGVVAKPEFPTVNDDPFTPLVSPSSVPAATETHADDPFAPLQPAPTTNSKPADPLVVEPTAKTIDMLAAGPDGRLPLREWTDNSGKFKVNAKLVLVLDGKVRLLKETGRTTTVVLERLSNDDRAYISAAIERYGEDLAKLHQFASR